MKLRPESSILLAAALALGAAVACEPTDSGSGAPPVGGTGGTGGIPGTSTTTGGVPGTSTTPGGMPGTSTTTGGIPGTSTTTGGIPGTSTTTGGIPGTSTTTGGTPGTSTTTGGMPGTSTTGGTPGTGTTTGGTPGAMGGGDAGVPGGTGGGPTMTTNFPGKYMGCKSWAAAMGTGDAKKCTSWYCNVTQGEIKTAFAPGMGKCGGRTPEEICDNKIVTDVGKCARDTKIANLFDDNATLRPKVVSCVRAANTTEYSTTKLPPECLDCFIDVAQCAGDNCSLECLSGDSADCDACRLQNNCDQKVFTCAGLPNTF